MRPSLLNKLIEIEKETTTINDVGTPTESYNSLKETYANVVINTGNTEYGEEGSLPFTRVTFTIRYDKDVNYKCRILYNTQYYKINHLEVIERNHWLKIRCIVWENELANG